MDTYAHDFGMYGRGATKSIHGNDLILDLANQKFTVGVEIVLFNGIHLVVQGTAPEMGFSLLNDKHMQVFNSGLVCRGITPDGKHTISIRIYYDDSVDSNP